MKYMIDRCLKKSNYSLHVTQLRADITNAEVERYTMNGNDNFVVYDDRTESFYHLVFANRLNERTNEYDIAECCMCNQYETREAAYQAFYIQQLVDDELEHVVIEKYLHNS